MAERITNQKQLILDYLQSTKNHPSAEEIFLAIKPQLPRISLGTIYRNLDNFVKKDIINELAGETKRFDADLTQHHHFICKKCHRIFDLDNYNVSLDNLKNTHKKIGHIDNYKIFAYGICKKCNSK